MENKNRLNQLYLYLTEGCNLRCRHCWLAPKHENENKKYKHMDFEVIKSVLKQGKEIGMAGIKLTGGEPLMHPRIVEIIDLIVSEGFAIVIETNGVLISDEIVSSLKKASRVSISISLDGVDKESHEWVRLVEGCFEKAVNGIKKLVEAGIKPQIIMSIMQHNKNQTKDLIKFAEEIGAGSVKFNIVMPTERGKKMHEQGETLDIRELVKMGEEMEKEIIPNSKIKVIFHHPIAFRPLSAMYKHENEKIGGCGIKGILGVLADGSFALCGIGSSVKEMIFGDAYKDKLKDIWENNEMLKDIRDNMPKKLEGICGKCMFKSLCLGSCVAQNYYRSKNLWAPFWYCEEAEKAGVYPESRKIPLKK